MHRQTSIDAGIWLRGVLCLAFLSVREEVGSLMCKINDLDSCSFGCASVTLTARGKEGKEQQ